MILVLTLASSCTDDESTNPVIDSSENPSETFAQYFDDALNTVVDPGFDNGSIVPTNDIGSNCPTGESTFVDANYKGAINPNEEPWYAGWSAYEAILAGNNTPGFSTGTEEIWSDAEMANAGQMVYWTADKKYLINGLVFINSGQTLHIEPGTIIQGMAGEAENASALIAARGSKIMAIGTSQAPIIFTYDGDNGGTAADQRGRWGGLIILGNSTLNSALGESAIEGIPTNEVRGLYGGDDESDNSGILKYVSIRHGGTLIGADNEINGLTLGGVGSGTTIEFVEVISNKDDGIEWFGGTVNAKYLIAAFCADDGLDYDEGFRGKSQFVIVHQDPTADSADRGGEHDGGTNPEDGTPYANPVFSNVTSVGNSGSRAITFRDNAGGEYYNSIFVNYAKGIDIEDILGSSIDSYKQFSDSILKLECNVFYNIGAGNSGSDLFTISN